MEDIKYINAAKMKTQVSTTLCDNYNSNYMLLYTWRKPCDILSKY